MILSYVMEELRHINFKCFLSFLDQMSPCKDGILAEETKSNTEVSIVCFFIFVPIQKFPRMFRRPFLL